MRTLTTQLLSLALLCAVPGLVSAQENADELGITMSVIEDEEAADERDFVNEIELPDIAADEAHSNAQEGNDTANQARQQGSEFGQERAEEGRNRGGAGGGQPPGNPPIP